MFFFEWIRNVQLFLSSCLVDSNDGLAATQQSFGDRYTCQSDIDKGCASNRRVPKSSAPRYMSYSGGGRGFDDLLTEMKVRNLD
jgi:hypothetical protein